MIKRIINRIALYLSRYVQPIMNYNVVHNGAIIKDTRISSSTVIEHPQKLVLNNNIFIGHYNYIEASNGMEIGEGCQITNFVSITTHSSHDSIRIYGKQYRQFQIHNGYMRGAIKIGEYTFIGPHCVIMPGTNIGKGCIIQAFSYVKGSFDDFSIIAGNPAKKIGDTRDRDKKLIEKFPELEKFYNEWAEKK